MHDSDSHDSFGEAETQRLDYEGDKSGEAETPRENLAVFQPGDEARGGVARGKSFAAFSRAVDASNLDATAKEVALQLLATFPKPMPPKPPLPPMPPLPPRRRERTRSPPRSRVAVFWPPPPPPSSDGAASSSAAAPSNAVAVPSSSSRAPKAAASDDAVMKDGDELLRLLNDDADATAATASGAASSPWPTAVKSAPAVSTVAAASTAAAVSTVAAKHVSAAAALRHRHLTERDVLRTAWQAYARVATADGDELDPRDGHLPLDFYDISGKWYFRSMNGFAEKAASCDKWGDRVRWHLCPPGDLLFEHVRLIKRMALEERAGKTAYKFGITHLPGRRLGYPDYIFPDRIIYYIAVSEDPFLIASAETQNIAVSRGDPRCQNIKGGGEGAYHGHSPFFLYLVVGNWENWHIPSCDGE